MHYLQIDTLKVNEFLAKMFAKIDNYFSFRILMSFGINPPKQQPYDATFYSRRDLSQNKFLL